MAGRKWTPREEKLLKKLYPQFLCGDISRADMVRVFSRTIGGIQIHAGRLCLTNIVEDKIDEKLLMDICKRLEI